jgi:hypothetical protein
MSGRTEAMARAAIEFNVGDGERTGFWYDRWIEGQSATDLAPELISFVSLKGTLLMTLAQARHNNTWISTLKGFISVPTIV